jgi:hypothetical protein
MNNCRVVLSLIPLAALCLGACAAQLAAPVDEKSAMIVVSADIEAKGLFGTVKKTAEPLSLRRIASDGSPETVPNHGAQDGYYFFPNVKPGKYEIAGANFPSKGGTTSTTPMAKSGNVTVGVTTTSGGSFASDYAFEPALAASTAVTVGEGQVSYMGHYVLKGEIKLFPPGAIGIDSAAGEKPPEGERKAFDYLKAKFPDSPWAKRVP